MDEQDREDSITRQINERLNLFDESKAHPFPEDDDFTFVQGNGVAGAAGDGDDGTTNGFNLDPC